MNEIAESDFYDRNSKYMEIMTRTGKTMKLYNTDCTIGMDFFPDHYLVANYNYHQFLYIQTLLVNHEL
jgi:hypothetical protein